MRHLTTTKGHMTVPQKPKTVSIPSTELNLRAGGVVRRVAVDREHVIIERNGFPLVVMLPLHDYQRLIAQEEQRTQPLPNEA